MKRWAEVGTNIVGLIVEQETQPTIPGIWVDITGQSVGPDFIYQNGSFFPPATAAPIITKLAFLTRFTDAEYTNILSASKTDIQVQAWNEKLALATQVNLQDQRTIDGVEMLVPKNLLTQQRATEILTAPVKSNERPQ